MNIENRRAATVHRMALKEALHKAHRELHQLYLLEQETGETILGPLDLQLSIAVAAYLDKRSEER